MAPWLFGPLPQDVAWKQLLQELGQLGATINTADEQAGLLAASVPYNNGIDVDDVEFLFKDGNLVLLRSQSRRSLPDGPFCIMPGCINGPRNRDRMASLRDSLGWGNMETDEDKQWEQIMMH